MITSSSHKLHREKLCSIVQWQLDAQNILKQTGFLKTFAEPQVDRLPAMLQKEPNMVGITFIVSYNL